MSNPETETPPDETTAAITEETAEAEAAAEGKEAAEDGTEETAETDETAAPDGEEGEPGEEEGAEAEKKADEPQAADEKRRRTGGWQRRLEKQAREMEQQARELAALREQVQRQAPAAKPEADMTPQEKAVAYIRGEVRREMEQAELVRQQQAVIAEFQRRTTEVRAKNPDYEEVIEAAAHVGVSDAVREAMLTSEHGPEIMYQLAKNPAELARLSALPPIIAARELGRLEAKFASVAPTPAKPKLANRPPAPPTSVRGSTSSTRSLEDLSLAEYKRAMRTGRR